jgi:hypothetical protein
MPRLPASTFMFLHQNARLIVKTTFNFNPVWGGSRKSPSGFAWNKTPKINTFAERLAD